MSDGAADHRATYVRETLERLVEDFPCRLAGSADERAAQESLGNEFARRGGECRWHSFRYSPNLYAVLVLHFGLATVASLLILVNPLIAFGLHILVLVSYVADATRLFQLLRCLLPRSRSQNLVVRYPAATDPRRRLVVMAHADAAYTGWIFLIKPPPPFRRKRLRILQRPMVLAVVGLLASVAIDLWAMWPVSLPWWMYAGYFGAACYFLLLALIHLQVVWTNRIVPGANDNLAACIGLAVLADRLAESKPDDIELVFVVTGSEEAGTGGALSLARAKRSAWDRQQTVIVNLDGIGDGPLWILEEGDIVHLPAADWLKTMVHDVAAEIGGHDPLPFTIPVGGTDALPFLVRGYPTITLGGLAPGRGAPRHYHQMSDTPANIDYDQVVTSLEFTERFLKQLGQYPEPAPAALSETAVVEDR